MPRMISIHSSRGGTGKSLIASNLAAILASRGLNVALLDFDFRAPSLSTIFQAEKGSHRYMNDYIDGKAKLGEVMVDLSESLRCSGTLRVGFANVELDAMREISRKDRKWQARALKKVLHLKEELSDLMGASLILIDTSPGIQYSSVNAVVGSDLSMIVATMDILDCARARLSICLPIKAHVGSNEAVLQQNWSRNRWCFISLNVAGFNRSVEPRTGC